MSLFTSKYCEQLSTRLLISAGASLKNCFKQLKINKHISRFISSTKTLLQIAEEGFLEFINNILTIGSVPALFTDDEKDTIIGNCRNAAKEAGYSVSK